MHLSGSDIREHDNPECRPLCKNIPCFMYGIFMLFLLFHGQACFCAADLNPTPGRTQNSCAPALEEDVERLLKSVQTIHFFNFSYLLQWSIEL